MNIEQEENFFKYAGKALWFRFFIPTITLTLQFMLFSTALGFIVGAMFTFELIKITEAGQIIFTFI